MADSFIDRLSTDSRTRLVQILEDVMDDLLIDHPEIEDTTLIRREAERALIALINEGQHDPIVLASHARAQAAWSIRPHYKLHQPIG